MKKAVSFVLALTICFMIFTLSTPVAYASVLGGSCGQNMGWSLDTDTGVLSFFGTGEMRNYSSSAPPEWNRYHVYIHSIEFANGISHIGDYAFYNPTGGYKYQNLSSVDLGTVSTIGDYAFKGCSGITQVSGTNSLTDIGLHSFRSCSSLTQISLPAIVYIDAGAFSFCTSLEDITFPSTLTNIGASAFSYCEAMETVTIPNGITSIGSRAFSDCINLRTINYNPIAVPTIGDGVFNNSGIENVLSATIGAGVTTIPEGLFSYCQNLSSVTLSSSVTTLGKNAFVNTGITQFNLTENINSISSTTFKGCHKLERFTVSALSRALWANSDGVLLTKNKATLVKYPSGKQGSTYIIPSTVTSLISGAFRESKHLTSINIPSAIKTIPSFAFADCERLTDVTLSSLTTTIGANAFASCPLLSNLSMNGVTSIGNFAFDECDSLTSLTLPSTLLSIGGFAFKGCSRLSSVTLPQGLTTLSSYAFQNCDELTSITIPSSVSNISEGAFSSCDSLSSVTIENGVTTISTLAFLNCPQLLSIEIPASVAVLGPNCLGYTGSNKNYTPVSGFKIICHSGSAAYTYATAPNPAFNYEIVTDSHDSFEIEDEGNPTQSDNNQIFNIQKFIKIYNVIRSFLLFVLTYLR